MPKWKTYTTLQIHRADCGCLEVPYPFADDHVPLLAFVCPECKKEKNAALMQSLGLRNDG